MSSFMLERASLIEAFEALGRLAWQEGITIEIAVYGGSALMLSYDWRIATRDVDAVYENDKSTVRRLAAIIAEERRWPADWLNDGVKGFLSDRDGDAGVKARLGEFPSAEMPGLRVFVAKAEYLFAMKCRAMRIGGAEHKGDIDDIRKLAKEIGLAGAEEALALVASFYPGTQLQPKVQFGIEEIFSQLDDHPNPSKPE